MRESGGKPVSSVSRISRRGCPALKRASAHSLRLISDVAQRGVPISFVLVPPVAVPVGSTHPALLALPAALADCQRLLGFGCPACHFYFSIDGACWCLTVLAATMAALVKTPFLGAIRPCAPHPYSVSRPLPCPSSVQWPHPLSSRPGMHQTLTATAGDRRRASHPSS